MAGIKISDLDPVQDHGGLSDDALFIVAQRSDAKGNPFDNYKVPASQVRPSVIPKVQIKPIVWNN